MRNHPVGSSSSAAATATPAGSEAIGVATAWQQTPGWTIDVSWSSWLRNRFDRLFRSPSTTPRFCPFCGARLTTLEIETRATIVPASGQLRLDADQSTLTLTSQSTGVEPPAVRQHVLKGLWRYCLTCEQLRAMLSTERDGVWRLLSSGDKGDLFDGGRSVGVGADFLASTDEASEEDAEPFHGEKGGVQ